LENLQLKRNRLGRGADANYENIIGLLERPSIKVLDISDNYIDDEKALTEVIYKMEELSVLYFQGNPVIKKTRNYRKTVTVAIPNLRYLDDRPVFEDDRRFAEAFSRGGFTEEKKERDQCKKEKDEAHWKNHQAFKDMMKKAREEKKVADLAKKAIEEGNKENQPEGEVPATTESLEEIISGETKPAAAEVAQEIAPSDEECPDLEEVTEEQRIEEIAQKTTDEEAKWLESQQTTIDSFVEEKGTKMEIEEVVTKEVAEEVNAY
jgi:dynein assembly factor 1